MINLQEFTKKRLQNAQTNENISMYSLNPEKKKNLLNSHTLNQQHITFPIRNTFSNIRNYEQNNLNLTFKP